MTSGFMTTKCRIERTVVWRVVDEFGETEWVGENAESVPLIFDTPVEAKDGLKRLVEEHRRREMWRAWQGQVQEVVDGAAAVSSDSSS